MQTYFSLYYTFARLQKCLKLHLTALGRITIYYAFQSILYLYINMISVTHMQKPPTLTKLRINRSYPDILLFLTAVRMHKPDRIQM